MNKSCTVKGARRGFRIIWIFLWLSLALLPADASKPARGDDDMLAKNIGTVVAEFDQDTVFGVALHKFWFNIPMDATCDEFLDVLRVVLLHDPCEVHVYMPMTPELQALVSRWLMPLEEKDAHQKGYPLPGDPDRP